MELYVAMAQSILVALGIAFFSGINLYAVVIFLGAAGLSGYIELPSALVLVQHPAVIAAAVVMYLAEFWADKVKDFETLWDSAQFLPRIVLGGILSGAMLNSLLPLWGVMVAGCAGALIAAVAHLGKSLLKIYLFQQSGIIAQRVMSVLEDVIVMLSMWMAFKIPVLFVATYSIAIVGFLALYVRQQALVTGWIDKNKRVYQQSFLKRNKNTPAVHIAPPSRPLTPTELLSSLERLQSLKAQGAIDSEEFTAQKQALIKTPQS